MNQYVYSYLLSSSRACFWLPDLISAITLNDMFFSWREQSKCCLNVSSLVLNLNNKLYTESIPHNLLPVAKSCLTLCDPMDCTARLPCPSPTPRACSNSCPSSQWCHPTISSSVVPFSCLQPFPASGSSRPCFPNSQSLPSGSLHKPLILIHPRADRSTKNYNPTVYRTKATITES